MPIFRLRFDIFLNGAQRGSPQTLNLKNERLLDSSLKIFFYTSRRKPAVEDRMVLNPQYTIQITPFWANIELLKKI